jgi:hypothetical protein
MNSAFNTTAVNIATNSAAGGQGVQPTKYFPEVVNAKCAPKSYLKTKVVHKEDSSLFIPMLPYSMVNEETLKTIMEENLSLGKVKRVDIVAKQNNPNRFMAFIHFEYWYDNYHTRKFRDLIKTNGQMDVYGYQECVRQNSYSMTSIIDDVTFTDWNNRKCYGNFIPPANGEYYGVYVPTNNFYQNASVFIRFMMNTAPIPETELNQHQVAHNLQLAQDEIQDLKTRVAQLEEIIKKLV